MKFILKYSISKVYEPCLVEATTTLADGTVEFVTLACGETFKQAEESVKKRILEWKKHKFLERLIPETKEIEL